MAELETGPSFATARGPHKDREVSLPPVLQNLLSPAATSSVASHSNTVISDSTFPPLPTAEAIGPIQDQSPLRLANAPQAPSEPQVSAEASVTDDGFVVVSRKRRATVGQESGKRPATACGQISATNEASSQPVIDTTPPTPKLPPIAVPQCRDWVQLLRKLQTSIPSGLVDAKSQGHSIRIFSKSVEDFRFIQRTLTTWQIAFHTFPLPEEREIKVVVSGVPADTDPLLVQEELERLGYSPTSVTLLRTREKFPVNSFLVKLRKVGPFQTIYRLTTFLYLRVQVRAFNARPGPPQCFSCQRYGHSSSFCHLPPRCVACGGEHRGGCQKPRETPATCCNCAGTHPANYRGCTAFKTALRKQRDNDRKVNTSRQPAAPARARREEIHPPASSQARRRLQSLTVPLLLPPPSLRRRSRQPRPSRRRKTLVKKIKSFVS